MLEFQRLMKQRGTARVEDRMYLSLRDRLRQGVSTKVMSSKQKQEFFFSFLIFIYLFVCSQS